MRAIAEAIDEPLVFLKAPTSPELVRSWLPPAWQVEQTGTLMLLDNLPSEGRRLPRGYASITQDNDVAQVDLVTPDGACAARGRMVVVDGVAVHDRIRTEDAHLRRGLGTAVMTILGQIARARGARFGMLSATDLGVALYATLGWHAVAPYTTAQLPA